jgi:hypothetical protein
MSFNIQKISVVHSDRVNHVCLIPTEFQPNQPIFLGVSERRGQKEYADSFLEKSTTPQSPTHCIVVYVCNQNQISMVGRTKIVTLRTQRICVPLSPSTLMFSRNVDVTSPENVICPVLRVLFVTLSHIPRESHVPVQVMPTFSSGRQL